ncbi:hypothetical protein AKJ16_DCAP02835 [Drosera capensis]
MATITLPSSLILRSLKTPKSKSKTLTLIRTQSDTRPQTPRKSPKRRSSYGTSRRSIIKKSLSQEQVVFSGPVSEDPVVGIFGGGMAGLVCGMFLERRGVRSTVFDTVGLSWQFDTRLDLSSIWALLAAFENPLPVPCSLEGAFVNGVDALSWMGNNSRKFSSGQHSGPEFWTFFSTASFGKQNKVPQENIPNVTAEKVKMKMLEGVEI